MTWTIIMLAVLAVVLWGFYVSWRASRLDRLHNRTEAARTALDLALVRRSSAATELAGSGLLDPATSLLLADAAHRARQAVTAERDLAESDLTRALRATVGDPSVRAELTAADQAGPLPAGPARTTALAGAEISVSLAGPGPAGRGAGEAPDQDGVAELLDEIGSAAHQVFIARKFYNDMAGRTMLARHRPLARVFRLSGRAAEPAFFEMDDTLTDGDGHG